MPDTTIETPETPKPKKRRTLRRTSGSYPGWEEREKARLEREARLDKFLNLAQEVLEKFSTPPPSHSSYAAPAMPEFDEDYYAKQKAYQHNYEMRSFLKNFVIIQAATKSNSIWQAHDKNFVELFKEIDDKYPVSQVPYPIPTGR